MKRLVEIDALRGIAIVLMVVFHFFFDLDMLGVMDLQMYEGGCLVLARVTQFLFLGLVGVSLVLSRRGFLRQLSRGAVIFGFGMLVTWGTYLFFPEDYVKFGILHLIGVAVPIVVLFKGRPWLAGLFALLSFWLGGVVSGVTVDANWLFSIGLRPAGFSSLDYFPVFPWISVVFVGLVLGEIIYGQKRPTFISPLGRIPGLSWAGRHSLLIYLVHQPLLYGGLSLMLLV